MASAAPASALDSDAVPGLEISLGSHEDHGVPKGVILFVAVRVSP